MNQVAEGVKSAPIVCELAQAHEVYMPIAEQMRACVQEGRSAMEAYRGLVEVRRPERSTPTNHGSPSSFSPPASHLDPSFGQLLGDLQGPVARISAKGDIATLDRSWQLEWGVRAGTSWKRRSGDRCPSGSGRRRSGVRNLDAASGAMSSSGLG